MQCLVQVVDCGAAAAGGSPVVPGLVRQALDVVGQVAGQIDDRLAQAGFGAETRSVGR